MRMSLIASAAFFCMGCSAADLPSRLPSAQVAMHATTGSQIVVYGNAGEDSTMRWAGELIAVEKETLFVLAESVLVSMPLSEVGVAKLFVTDVPVSTGMANLWVATGVLSSASLGYGAIFAAPAWLLFGSIFASAYSSSMNAGDLRFPEEPWVRISPFARFPQGLPVTLDRSQLRPRVDVE